MEYTHNDHLSHAHNTGLVIGTLVGACAVSVFMALAVVVASPHLLLHPLDFTSELSVRSKQSVPTDGTVGPAASSGASSNTLGVAGPAAQAAREQ
jgi:hypothetical protein